MPKAKKSLLIVDDDRNFCLSASEYLRSDELEVNTAHTASECLAACSRQQVDVVLLDQKLPDAEGHTICPSILEFNSQSKIIFTTAFPSFDNAVKAVRAGAFDYLSKPFDPEELELAVRQALRTLGLEKVEQFQNYRTDRESEENILAGETTQIVRLRELIDLASNAEAPVLITGETGAGKNIAARSIHYRGRFRHAPFISINCAALPETLIEAELFGHDRGAFTGAASAKKGMFEMAEGGTLFLDEIGEMPVALQSKLLGVLDDGMFRRLGGTTAIRAQVRVVAATSVELEKAIKNRKFREDLYYRLGVIKMHLPPLRERRDDIPHLCSCLLKKIAKGRRMKMADGESERLKGYPWPGNVRELRNLLERAAILQHGDEIRPSVLLGRPEAAAPPCTAAAGLPASNQPAATLGEIERSHILSELQKQGGNFSRTARAIGISLSTLKRRLKQYSLR